MRPFRSRSRGSSVSSDDSHDDGKGRRNRGQSRGRSTSRDRRRHKQQQIVKDGKLPPPILVYHESARSIVFRDHLRRAASRGSSNVSEGEMDLPDDIDKPSATMAAAAAPTTDNNKTKEEEGGEKDTKDISKDTTIHDGKDNNIKIPQSPKQPPPQQHATAAVAAAEVPPRRDTFIDITSELTHQMGLDHGETVKFSETAIATDQIANFQPRIQPLQPLALGPDDRFEALLEQPPTQCASDQENDDKNPKKDDTTTKTKNPEQDDWSPAEREVVRLLQTQQATVKTIRNGDWTAFLKRFQEAQPHSGRWATDHSDIAPHDGEEFPFNSFVTSTSLLPDSGQRMRCFGSLSQFTTGVVFALPSTYVHPEDGHVETEEEALRRTRTWSWPSGYSAKTEFNIDGRGNLINGRQEALTPLPTLRQYNHEYLHCEEYTVAGRKVSGLSQIPYNEVFLRVGGRGRIVEGKDVATGQVQDDAAGTGRSLDAGVGLPIALFVRGASFSDLIALLRTRARLAHTWGEKPLAKIPLLLITPEEGTRVLTESLQIELWKLAASNLNPFQNPSLARRTTIETTDIPSFQQKVDELLDLDSTIREKLTPDELAHLAGGFGATDESVADILKTVMLDDIRVDRKRQHSSDETTASEEQSHQLQNFVNEGLTAAVRSGDYNTAKQLLILYTVVATKKEEMADADEESLSDYSATEFKTSERSQESRRETGLGKDAERLVQDLDLVKKHENKLSKDLAPPPPPPLDTDRLRGATNSDGLLAVLGAAQILKAMQDGGAKKRTDEVVDAVDEWVQHGEQSMAFRISSWYDQRAAQGDLQIATENDSNFMAFVSNKAIANRRGFADQLRQAVGATDFTDVRFLRAIEEMVGRMHAPCLRLELLQYVLGLDNRFSVSHVARAVHLAVTCLGVSSAV